jgi:hypothetical protein
VHGLPPEEPEQRTLHLMPNIDQILLVSKIDDGNNDDYAHVNKIMKNHSK